MSLLTGLFNLSRQLPFHDEQWKRLRIAVSPQEFDELRTVFLISEGVFHARLRGIPLIIEKEPNEPPHLMRLE